MATSESILSWYSVSEDVKHLLMSAAATWENTAESEAYINQALAHEDVNLDVLVTAYRYFFYKNNNRMALQMAERVLQQIKAAEQLPEDWNHLKPILLARKEEPQIRLYLNSYAASGFVLARLGEVEQAKKVTARVSEVDDRKEFGAALVFDILTHPDEDDD